MENKRRDRFRWPVGNRLDMCINLRQITVTDGGTQFGDYIPSAAAVVKVWLVGNYASFEYDPRIDGSKLYITDNGELKVGVYAIDVRVQEPERKLRSFRCGEMEIVRETRQLALGDFILDNNITLDADAFVFGEGPSAYEVAVRDGYTGTKAEWLESLRGKEGRGIADIVSLPTGAFRILLTDGSAYVTPTLKGEQGVSIVDFAVSSITSQEVICTVTMSDGTTRQLNLPRGEQGAKGDKGDDGQDGRGIQSIVLNADYTLTFNYTDGTTYTTPQSLRGEKGENGQDGQDGRGISSMSLDDDSHLTVSYTDGTTFTTPQSLQGERGVSITDFEQVGESATMTFFNIYYSNGNISQIGLPKGEQGDRGEQGPQGPKGDTVVLGEVGEYKLYNVAGSATDGAMTQDATTKAIAANTGYYECGTAAGTAAKVAVGDNEALYTLQKGGSIKVKMKNANAAASGVTLKIGSAAATPLYYNGEAVSASNTWEAGEVVDVYYDGSVYQASNAQGGGGKAEKIKYDNSQSGLAADNVQEALDKSLEASVIREQPITTSSNTKINFNVATSTSKWVASETDQHSNIFVIPEGVYKIKLTPTSAIMMWSLLYRYEPAATNGTVYVASGLSARYSSSVETEITNLSNAKFLCVRADDTEAKAMCPIITFCYNDKIDFINNEAIENTEEISNVTKFVFNSGTPISSPRLYGGYIEDSGKWYKVTSSNTIQGAHYEYPVVEGELYRIDAGALDSVIYWLTESVGHAVNNTDAPITGSKIAVKANTSIVVKVPADAAYMAVMYSYYTAIIMPTSVVKLSSSGEDLSDIIPSYIIENAKSINLQSYSVVTGMLNSRGVWQTSKGKHIAIPVTEGEKYVIHGDGNSFWGWVTDAYSTPVTANSSVPYVSGYFRVYQKDAVAVTVPSGAAYLILCTVNGGGTSSTWSLYKVSSYRKRNPNELVKFRMASWNIGQFKYVDWDGSSTHVVPADQADAVALRFKKLINSTNADVLGICEYNPSYSASDLNPRNVIFQCYKNAHVGHKDGANCNALFSNIFTFGAPEEINFAVENENRYYLHTTSRLFDENIHIVEAHLDHTTQADRAAQIEELINKMSGYRYVIIAGDFNTGNTETIESEIAAFTDAGFKAANGGYLGIYSTSHVGHPVDHIMVKGFAMSNIQVSQESDSLSDHMVVYCDLTMLNT